MVGDVRGVVVLPPGPSSKTEALTPPGAMEGWGSLLMAQK